MRYIGCHLSRADRTPHSGDLRHQAGVHGVDSSWFYTILRATSVVLAVVATACSAELDHGWRLGYVGSVGHVERNITSASAKSSGDYSESAIACSYLAIMPASESEWCDGWIGECAGEYGLGKLGNNNGSIATQQAYRISVLLGPRWTLFGSDFDSVDVHVAAFAGAGGVTYDNAYGTASAGATAQTTIEADGLEASYGARLAVRWRFLKGWGESLSIGVVRRHSWLSGDSSTAWSNGSSVSDAYRSEGVVSALMFSFSAERSF